MSTKTTRSNISKVKNTKQVRVSKKTSTQKNEYLLAYCHSKKHCNNEIKNEIKQFNDNIIIDTNDVYDYMDGDYTIDLSNTIFTKKYLMSVYNKKYDYIYLVNCPSNAYIKDNNLNPIIFHNMIRILKPDGILMTKFSDDAIQSVSMKEVHVFLDAVDHPDLSPEFLQETNKTILEEKKVFINIARKNIVDYLIRENINLRLLTYEENKSIVSPMFNDDNIGAGYHEFFIFKKNNKRLITIKFFDFEMVKNFFDFMKENINYKSYNNHDKDRIIYNLLHFIDDSSSLNIFNEYYYKPEYYLITLSVFNKENYFSLREKDEDNDERDIFKYIIKDDDFFKKIIDVANIYKQNKKTGGNINYYIDN